MSPDITRIIDSALSEDIGHGDITSSILIPDDIIAIGMLIAEDDIVLAGLPVAAEVFKQLDKDAVFDGLASDGDLIKAGSVIARVSGKGRALLSAERVALNFLQRLSGISTLSRRYADAVMGLPVRISDTRKTTPGLRPLEKYAVRAGGCFNHRYGLFDSVLIKENHIALTSGVEKAVSMAKINSPHTMKVEVEVKTLDEVKVAVMCEADIIMLDNMDISMMREAVRIIRENNDRKILIEASGGMSLDRVRDVALTGVDIISVGALTHAAAWVNISMDIEMK
ncbi:MAG: carboxylating nicotinate-nucleotide diphosphorylase [Nitrospirae bacterium]|nr:carboxylating nicotinate-nucleotide diphosphorylase [Nitrospirota bacterium]